MKNWLLVDRDYLRIPTKNKAPIRKDWSIPINHYYKEPKNTLQLLKEYGEYGVRLGLFVKEGYHLGALIFRKPNDDLDWKKYFADLFPEISYTETEKGLYYWILIKELPPNGTLKNFAGENLGDFYGSGKLVVGAGSRVGNFRYQWVKRKISHLLLNTWQELQECFAKKELKLVVVGKTEWNKEQNEWVCSRKLDLRWKRRNFELARREKEKKLKKLKKKASTVPWKKCLTCQVRYKYKDKHLLKCSVKEKISCYQCHRKMNASRLRGHVSEIHLSK